MNQLLQHLKHEMNHGTRQQQLNALNLCLMSIVCWKKGKEVKRLLDVAKMVDHNEAVAVHTMMQSFGNDEYERIKKLWDSYGSPKEVDKSE